VISSFGGTCYEGVKCGIIFLELFNSFFPHGAFDHYQDLKICRVWFLFAPSIVYL